MMGLNRPEADLRECRIKLEKLAVADIPAWAVIMLSEFPYQRVPDQLVNRTLHGAVQREMLIIRSPNITSHVYYNLKES
jgi:hypothetical protein